MRYKSRKNRVFQNGIKKGHNKLFAIIIFVLVIFSFIFDVHRCEALENIIKTASRDKLTFTGNWDENKALKIVTYICKGWLFDDAQGGYNIKSSLSFRRNNINKRLFQISANGESCRFCPGLIGVVVFSENNGIWEVQFEEEHFARFGCHGLPPEAKLLRIGSNRYGLLFQWWRMLQGYCREVEEREEEGYLVCSGGYAHYVAIIDLGDKKYPLILEDETHQIEEDFYDQPPVIPKVEVISTTNDNFYRIRINSKIYTFENGKYKTLGTQPEK